MKRLVKRICQKWGIEFLSFPIKDVNIPKNENEFIQLAKNLASRINENQKVVMHCRMGIGRASILAAAIMINLGCDEKNVFQNISKFRKLQVPDTEEQKNWILSIAEKLKKSNP